MPVTDLHPMYVDMLPHWTIVRDVYAGESEVKSKGELYLPATQGMRIDGYPLIGSEGYYAYEAYKLRAFWHSLYNEAIQAYVGMLWSKPANIALPAGMENVLSNFGETPVQLLRRINEEQLISSRAGLLVDLPLKPDPAKPDPYITMYKAEHVRNWDDSQFNSTMSKLNFVIVDESGYERKAGDLFTWQLQKRYRVCLMDDGVYKTGLFNTTEDSTGSFNPGLMTTPMLRGAGLSEVPFYFINSQDNLPAVVEPVLIDLARAMLAIYRGEADYRQSLFMQGQDTLVTIGGVKITDSSQPDAALRTGVGARIDMEAGGDAKYIGVSSSGLPEQRVALQNDRSRAEVRAGQLIAHRAGDQESGEALKTRMAAQTATLTSIALSGASGLERALKQCASWMGKDPTKVNVKANEDFSSAFVTGQDLFQLMEAKDKGLPISYESIHAYMVDRGVTRQTFEEEYKAILAEKEKTKVFMNPVIQEQTKEKNKKPPVGVKPGAEPNNPNGNK